MKIGPFTIYTKQGVVFLTDTRTGQVDCYTSKKTAENVACARIEKAVREKLAAKAK